MERRSHDYVRHGITSPFAALEVATGAVTGTCDERHRHEKFLAVLTLLDRVYPRKELHIVLDNVSSHQTLERQYWLRRHPRVHLYVTATGYSWINQVETWFSILSRRAIHRGAFKSLSALTDAIQRFLDGLK